MAPTVIQLSCQLRQIVYYHLDNGLYSNALFLSERLHGLDPKSLEALYLLSLCHRRLGQNKIAYDYLRPVALKGGHLGCAYIFAQVCLTLGKYADGVAALEKTRTLWEGKNTLNKHSETLRRHLPDAAACHCLLGKLFHADRQVKRAVDCYVEALKLNPFMWDAFERLCDTGQNFRSSNIFKISPVLLNLVNTAQNAASQDQPRGDVPVIQDLPIENYHQSFMIGNDPFVTSTVDHARGLGSTSVHQKVNGMMPANSDVGIETPPHPGTQINHTARAAPAPGLEPPNAPSRRPRAMYGLGVKLRSDTSKPRMSSPKGGGRSVAEEPASTDIAAAAVPGQKRTLSGSMPQNNAVNNPTAVNAPQRRSHRIGVTKPTPSSAIAGIKEGFELTKARATGTIGTRGRSAGASSVGRVVSGNRKPLIEGQEAVSKEPRTQNILAPDINNPKVAVYDSTNEIEALRSVLDLLGRLAHGYHAASRYQSQAALQYYQNIPPHQKETPWVLAQMGKALHEEGKYAEAEKFFARIRKKVPSRLEDMEVYSTVLWHLKSDVELAFLSHELLDKDRFSPQAWCAIGNSFSLQRDHDQALKCFKRATQLDSKFAYSFTLQGHEYSANEEYGKALQAYRKAISADHRHYNGWYGLARVYEKMGKYDMAEEHYRAAVSINPSNAVLVWSIGMVLEKQKKHKAALVQYKHACELAPRSAMPRFKKARILLHLQLFEDALEEFNILKDMVPDESNVHFMLGKVHKHLNNKSDAVKHFTIALNLDPKAAPYIKETMESIDQDGEEDSDEDEDMS